MNHDLIPTSAGRGGDDGALLGEDQRFAQSGDVEVISQSGRVGVGWRRR